MGSPDTPSVEAERRRHRIRLARLEADLAYFQARLEIIGDPTSPNQNAQRKVFKLLHKSIAARVLAVKREYSELV